MNREILLNALIDKTRALVGVPFKHQGRTKKGVDCIGLILVPLNEIGYFSYDNINYKRLGYGDGLIDFILKHCYEVKNKNNLEKGDILLFSNKNSQHLALYTGTTIIHANNVIGKVVEHDLNKEWIDKISKVFRYKGE